MIKRYTFLFVTLICLAFLLPVSQAFAQFSADKSSGCAPLLVQLTGPAGEYDFDGATGPQGFTPTAANPGRQYLSAGTYTVLYRPDAFSPSVPTGVTITVYPKPIAAFNITQVAGVTGTVGVATGCAPLTVKFADVSTSDASSPIIGRTWYFGDGSSSTEQNPSHVYSNVGTYAVELVVKTANCQQNIKKTDVVVVTEPPVLDFSTSPGASCGPETVQFTNTSTKLGKNPTYEWEFRDANGNIIGTSTLESPAILFTAPTSYTAKLTVRDASGCTSTLTKNNVFAISNNYITDFSHTINPGTCSPINVTFTSQFLTASTGGQQVNWEVIDPATNAIIGTFSGINPPAYSFASAGTYKIRVTSSGGTYNCPPVTINKDISIQSGGEARFTATNNTDCKLPLTASFDGSSSTGVVGNSYEWNFGDGQTGTGVSPNHIYTNYGSYTVQLTITDANGCKNTMTKEHEVRISEVYSRLSAYLTYGCNDSNGDFTVNFIDNSYSEVPITQWRWEFFNEAGTKVGEVQGSDPNVHKNANFTFNTINANNGRERYTVRLTVSTANGCSNTFERRNYIVVGDKPNASFTANPSYGCPNTTVNFTYGGSTPFDSIYWFPLGYGGTRITRQGNQNPNLDYTYNVDPGTYVAGLVVWNGGCGDSTRYSINNPIDPRFTQLAPRARASWSIDNCNPGSVFFTDQSMGAQYWRWDLGSAAVPNAYPNGAAIRDFLPGTVPNGVRNPVVNYPGPGTYTVTLYTEADNIYYVTNPVTGARLQNSSGNPITYTTNPNEGNAPLHFGSITTPDSILIIRCRSEVVLTVVVPSAAVANVNISSDYNPANPNCFPVVVNFQNNTAGAVSWYWILGNGQVSTLQNPTGIVYDKPGKYTVELVVTTANGCKFRKRFPDYVIVNGPLVNFDYCEADVCVSQNMQFKDLTTSGIGVKYRTWDMGNGILFSNDPAVTSAPLPAGAAADLSAFSYAYPAAPPDQYLGYDVKLTVTEQSGCQASKTVKIRPTRPVPDFSVSATTVNCEEEEVTVQANLTTGFGPFRYRWVVFPKGSATPEVTTTWSDNSEAKFRLKATSSTLPKEYEIRLQVEDFKYVENASNGGSGIGCYNEKIADYTVRPGQITVDFSWAGPPSKCPPREVEFTDKSVAAGSGEIVTWLWNFGDGTTSNLQNPKKIYTEPNPLGYTVTLTVTDKNGCQQTKIDPNAIILDGIAGTFTIQQISGTDGLPPTPYPLLTAGSTIDYIKGIFTPNPYQVQFDAVVKPADLPLIGSFIWDFGDGVIGFSTPPATKSEVHEYSYAGIYYPSLIIRSKDGCDYGAPADIYVIANECLAPTIEPVNPVCQGEMITLVARPPAAGIGPWRDPVWTNLDTRTVIPNQDPPLDPDNPEYIIRVPLSKATNFSFQITNGADPSCTSYTAILVKIHTPPVAEAGENQTVCQGTNVTVTAAATGGSGSYKYKWTTFPDIGSQESNNPSFTVNNPASSATAYQFTLLVTDLTTGCTSSDKVTVKVNSLPTVDAGPTAEVCSGSSTFLQPLAAGGTGNPSEFTYRWTAGPGPGGLSPMSAVADPNSAKTLVTLTNLTAATQTYTYRLTITDLLGCTATDVVDIVVSPGLSIALPEPLIICEGESVKLTPIITGGSNNPGRIFTYKWSPATSLDRDDIAEPMATPTGTPTDYTLSVTEIVNGEERCGGVKTVRVNWSPPIVVTINGSQMPDPVTVCKGGTTQFSSTATGGTGALIYRWTWEPLPAPSATGFLNVVSGNVTPTITTNVNGITNPLEYTLTVTDSKGCTGSARIQVRIPQPLADAGQPQELCLGENTFLLGKGSNGLAPYKFRWSVVSAPAGAIGLKAADVAAQIDNPEFVKGNPAGKYVFALVVEDARGCISENPAQVTILVNPLPDAPLITGRTDYCRGETISLTASGLPTGIFKWYTESTLSPLFQIYEGTTYETPAITSVNYYVTQTNPITGCVSPPRLVKVTVNDLPPPPLVEEPAAYCPGDVIAPLQAAGTNLKWYADIDLKILLAQNVNTYVSGVPSVTGRTTFYVTQSNGNCEGPPAAIEVIVNPTPPAPQVRNPVLYCLGDLIAPLTAVGENLKWYSDAGLTTKVGEGAQFDTKMPNVVSSKTFYVTQTILGCVSPPSPVTVEIRPLPLKPSRQNITYCFEGGKKYTLDAGPGFAGYVWEHSGEKTQTVAVTQEGVYYVNLMNEAGCSVRDSVVVAELCPPRIFVPSAFTPNGDGKNDNMQVFGRHFHDLVLTIYNRWGEIIYIGKDQAEPWDGYYRGELVQLGTYPWELKAVADIDGSIIQMRGIVTVIR
jgi:gliding motility-associated-like protein